MYFIFPINASYLLSFDRRVKKPSRIRRRARARPDIPLVKILIMENKRGSGGRARLIVTEKLQNSLNGRAGFRKSCGFRRVLFVREILAEFSHDINRGWVAKRGGRSWM